MIRYKEAKKQWESILPYFAKIRKEYTKDENLLRRIDVMINHIEPALGKNEIASEHAQVLLDVLSSDYYYRNRTDIRQDEEDYLRDLAIHLDLFVKFARKEENVKDEEKKEEKIERKPNIDNGPDLYEKTEGSRERIL